LVPPSAASDYRCVNLDLTELPGFNVLVYVRDSGDGKTAFGQIGLNGANGAACAQYPEPGPDGLLPLTDGDLKGMVQIHE
jgi:hypothetical protein